MGEVVKLISYLIPSFNIQPYFLNIIIILLALYPVYINLIFSSKGRELLEKKVSESRILSLLELLTNILNFSVIIVALIFFLAKILFPETKIGELYIVGVIAISLIVLAVIMAVDYTIICLLMNREFRRGLTFLIGFLICMEALYYLNLPALGNWIEVIVQSLLKGT